MCATLKNDALNLCAVQAMVKKKGFVNAHTCLLDVLEWNILPSILNAGEIGQLPLFLITRALSAIRASGKQPSALHLLLMLIICPLGGPGEIFG